MNSPLEVALRAVAAAAPLLHRPLLGKPPTPAQVSEKAAHDYWTELDVAIERAVAGVVLEAFPDHTVHGEEVYTPAPGVPDVWYLDPIDGTRNLVAGRPEVAVSLAWYREGQPQVAVVQLPCRDLTLAADASRPGLIVNGAPFTPPAPPTPDRALAGMAGDVRDPGDVDAFHPLFGTLARQFEGVRISGALGYDLACMALGELDARVSLHAKPVDVAAGALLVHQAGGVVGAPGGGPLDLHAPGVAAARSPSFSRPCRAPSALGTCPEHPPLRHPGSWKRLNFGGIRSM